jgi:hypothetical protein
MTEADDRRRRKNGAQMTEGEELMKKDSDVNNKISQLILLDRLNVHYYVVSTNIHDR